MIDAHRFCPGMSASAANSYNMQGLAPSSPIDMFSSVSLIKETGVGVWGGGLHAVFYFFYFLFFSGNGLSELDEYMTLFFETADQEHFFFPPGNCSLGSDEDMAIFLEI